MKLSESDAIEVADEPIKKRAIAYFRSSSERRSEHSITPQQAQVRAWAAKNGLEIIREFLDVGKSGNICEDRPAFDEMMANWVMERTDFSYILCLDVSRLGRSQDDDRSIQLSAQCKKHNMQLIYTGAGKPLWDDSL